MPTLRPEPLTAAAFAPFGDVIELAGAKQFPINAGTTIRFHDLAKVDVLAEDARVCYAFITACVPDVKH